MKNIQDVNLKNKNVLLRIDADVPIVDGKVTDDERIQASVPTLKYLLENGAKVTIISHIGRPGGKKIPELRILPVEDKLIELIGTHNNWQILENLRFNSGEEDNDPEFVKQLTTGQDIFVQDAFASCHRAHASTVGVAKLLPSYAGLNVENEIMNLNDILASPVNGFTIIIGGKKAKDKLAVIDNLFEKANTFLVGGVVADTFLAGMGYDLGKSLVEEEMLGKTKEIINKFKTDKSKKLLLPVDLLVSKSLEISEGVREIGVKGDININNEYIVDIGTETIANFIYEIHNSKTIFFNGNLGITEVEEFSGGTMKIAEAISNSRAKKYIGGGDTTSFIRKVGLDKNFDYISTGGGATLEFLAGKNLPGLTVLEY